MAMGQQKDRQGDLMVSWSEMPRSPGHVFYDRLQLVLIEGGFDGFAEAVCQPYYAARMGAPSVPPGRYFRMHLVGYFEGIDSERGLEWRCSDSLSLREFLLLEMRERVPDHSWLSRTRARLPHEVHTAVFDWVLALIAEAGLVKGERIGVDASTMEANAALRNIVRRDTGEGYRGMLERLAQESGIETPTAEDLARLDRKRKGKTRISHRRIVWSLIIYCKQTVIEIFGKRQKYRVFFRSGPFFVRRREGLHGFGEPLQGAPCRRPVFPVLQHIDDRLVG